jgi:hypothetical protein
MSDYKRKKPKSDKPLTREEELKRKKDFVVRMHYKKVRHNSSQEKSKVIMELRHEFDLEIHFKSN